MLFVLYLALLMITLINTCMLCVNNQLSICVHAYIYNGGVLMQTIYMDIIGHTIYNRMVVLVNDCIPNITNTTVTCLSQIMVKSNVCNNYLWSSNSTLVKLMSENWSWICLLCKFWFCCKIWKFFYIFSIVAQLYPSELGELQKWPLLSHLFKKEILLFE